MERHCALPQTRARLVVNNIVINMPLHEGPQLSCYDVLAEAKGWSWHQFHYPAPSAVRVVLWAFESALGTPKAPRCRAAIGELIS